MSDLIHVAIGESRIVHDKAVICKEDGLFLNGIPACIKCAFKYDDCKDIACTPSVRDDKKFVYFQRI